MSVSDVGAICSPQDLQTGVDTRTLVSLGKALTALPESLRPHKKARASDQPVREDRSPPSACSLALRLPLVRWETSTSSAPR